MKCKNIIRKLSSLLSAALYSKFSSQYSSVLESWLGVLKIAKYFNRKWGWFSWLWRWSWRQRRWCWWSSWPSWWCWWPESYRWWGAGKMRSAAFRIFKQSDIANQTRNTLIMMRTKMIMITMRWWRRRVCVVDCDRSFALTFRCCLSFISKGKGRVTHHLVMMMILVLMTKAKGRHYRPIMWQTFEFFCSFLSCIRY